MISALRGTVLSVAGGTAVIDVGGVGFAVAVTARHALTLRTGTETTLLTSLIVREDSLSLFGFPDQDSLDIFTLLTGVTGVGPKSALGVLSELAPSDVATAVAREDDSVFRKVSGIGPKTAKLIVLQLTGKIAARAVETTEIPSGPPPHVRANVERALVGLGWPERSASSALEQALESASPQEAADVQGLLRLALAILGPSPKSGDSR
ncbi:Holliday junction branch migration protein RuvA [Herbiconiux sp. CPCC 203407]|uniref:Holliday junction branch migration complex subunit RuvA n=1 Tax=Herbiconiux oxytropis TaxID=2970915 RepID=A0AA42BV39_9MICO|nr:Holliday junction branch migration protein RuvA [Herbiconiux oxytropis]MCS5720446.1 Holliday junction branch migration protein RuvA [Herbiconiux oxytropis]MCS5726019.1 Holliday junction branch migration protein RuvA [Herbiconiux oxytropis]